LEKPILVTATSTIIAVAISIAYAAFSFGVDSFSSLPMTTIIPISLFKPATILVYLYTITLWSWEGLAYWSKINQKERLSASGIGRGIRDAIFHKNFLGGGEGCKVPKLNSRYLRVISHLLVFFGFITALVSISFYPDITGYFALAYLFGSCSVTIGTAGMIYIHLKESKRSRSDEQALIDYPFTILLFFAGITGIIVPLSLGTTLFNWNFIIHDALIMVVFLLAPFSKFIHPVFRIISLMKYSSDSLRLSQK
jgi:citrate/tricarballylate utilization protein